MQDPEQSYFWLSRHVPVYRYTVQLLVDRLHAARGKNPFPVTSSYLDTLRSISSLMGDDLERAQICLECAWADYKIRRLDRAKADIQEALDLLDGRAFLIPIFKHYRAVASWMMGSLLKDSPARRRDAVIAWQDSLDAFTLLSYHFDVLPADQTWYRNRCTEMRQAIEDLISTRPGRAKKTTSTWSQPQSYNIQLWTPAGRTAAPRATLFSGALSSINVIGEIRAGKLGPSDIETEPIETLALGPLMEEFTLEGQPYQLFNLRSANSAIKLSDQEQYFILKVIGDSMNKAGISPKDYVLLRRQAAAYTGDIVAAEVMNEETKATLKRFIRRNQDIELRPESTNPQYEPYFFTTSPGEGFYIRGVMLGVFKPVT